MLLSMLSYGQIIIKDLSNKIVLINSIKKLDDIDPIMEVV